MPAKGGTRSAPPSKAPCSTPLFPESPSVPRPRGQPQDSRHRPGPGRGDFLPAARGSEHPRALRPYTPSPHRPARPGYTTAAPGTGWGRARPGMEPQTGTDPPEPPPSTTAVQAHYVAGNTARLNLTAHYLARALRPTPAPPPLSPGESRPGGGAGEARSPLSHSPCPRQSPPGPWAHYHQGGPARPSAIPRLPLPALTGPGPASPRQPRRLAIGCPPEDAATPLVAAAVHHSRPTPFAYGAGAAEEPHPRRPRKERQ